jgi:energy-coupling factor transporter ATP-binding protein EcfA2
VIITDGQKKISFFLFREGKMVPDGQNIRYLGFVVNRTKPHSEQLTHALVNTREKPEQWHVIELSESLYSTRLKGSVSRYFRNIFWLSIQIWNAYNKKEKLRKGYMFLSDSAVIDVQMAKYLREENRGDKVKGASKDFPKIRKVIYNSLFAAGGSKNKNNLHVLWKGPSTPKSIFFWTHLQFKESPLKDAEELPFGKVTIDNLKINSAMDPQTLSELASSLLFTEEKTSWQDLYFRSLIAESEMADLMNVELLCENKATDEHNEPCGEILKTLVNNRRAIIYGESGSGKTTLLKQVAAYYAKQATTSTRDKLLFPILMTLKDFEITENTDLHTILCTSVCNAMSKVSMSELETWYVDGTNTKPNNKKQIDKESIISVLKSDIRAMLQDETQRSKLVLLIDGLSDVISSFMQHIVTSLQEGSSFCNNIIITAKDTNLMLSELHFSQEFKIAPLSEEYVIQFIRRKRPDWPKDRIFSLPDSNPKLFELLTRPFYLKVFCDSEYNGTPEAIVASRAKLIESMVISAKQRKERAKETGNSRIDLVQLNQHLAVLANRILLNVGSGKKQFLDYPDDFDRTGDWDAIINYGQVIGIIKTTEEVFSKSLIGRRIAFEHDLFRDFYAALWLKQNNVDRWNSNRLEAILEDKIWDSPIKMFCELGNGTISLDNLILNISLLDPYFASDCIEPLDKISDATLSRVLVQLKKWECDFFEPEQKIFSCAGKQAATRLLKKQSLGRLYSIISDKLQYSLEAISIPSILAADKRTSIEELMRKMIALPKSCRPTILEVLSTQNSEKEYRVLVRCVDAELTDMEIMAQSQREPVDSVTRQYLINYLLRAEYKPNYAIAVRLASTIFMPCVRSAVFLKGSSVFTIEELKELSESSDDILKLIAQYNLNQRIKKGFASFAEVLKDALPNCVDDPIGCFLLIFAATQCPEYIEKILANCLEASPIGPNRFGAILDILALCGSEYSTNYVIRWLSSQDPALLLEILFSNNSILRSISQRKQLIAQLMTEPFASMERSRYLRYMLGDDICDSEYNLMCEQLNLTYETLKNQNADQPDREFELRVLCVITRKSVDNKGDHFRKWSMSVLKKIAPSCVASQALSQEHAKIKSFFESPDEDEIEKGIEKILALPIRHEAFDDQVRVIISAIRISDLHMLMSTLWKIINRSVRTYPVKARRLLYWYWALQQRTGRRWISSRSDCHSIFPDLPLSLSYDSTS